MSKLEWPEWMTEYPIDFWEDHKVQEYVELAWEYFKTLKELEVDSL